MSEHRLKGKQKIAIVGHGFVGKAIEYGFNTNDVELMIIDPQYGTHVSDLEAFAPDVTFISVPTPMSEDGTIDDRIIQSVVAEVMEMPTGMVVIKSTVTPDVIDELTTRHIGSERIVYNPEFLTERAALEEFINPKFHIMGGEYEYTKQLKRVYQQYSQCSPCKVFYMTPMEASFVKYGINSFLATKVLWFNQFKDLLDRYDSRYSVVANAVGYDKRIGNGHTKVPGFDGKKGFGGSCFPKDTAAIANFAQGSLTVLEEVMDVNNLYRSQYMLDDREKEQNITYNSTVTEQTHFYFNYKTT